MLRPHPQCPLPVPEAFNITDFVRTMQFNFRHINLPAIHPNATPSEPFRNADYFERPEFTAFVPNPAHHSMSWGILANELTSNLAYALFMHGQFFSFGQPQMTQILRVTMRSIEDAYRPPNFPPALSMWPSIDSIVGVLHIYLYLRCS